MRQEELNMDFLQYYRLVSRWACKSHDLNIADLELLLYLNPIKYFTIHDFKTGTLLVSWDKTRFYRLQREDWITKIHDGKGRTGGHSKYVVSSKGKRLINRIGRILDGREEIPESKKRNNIMKRKTFSDKLYSEAIKKFNRNRE